MTTQCCVCLKVKQGTKWIKVDKPYQVMQEATHTYCPRCLKMEFGSLKKLRAAT